MHSISCPSCGMRIELDFQPVAGLVWCPKCKKTFSPPGAPGPEAQKTDQLDAGAKRNGESRQDGH